MPVDAVANLNVPTCDTGEQRGLVEVSSATTGNVLDPSDCTSTVEGPTDDVVALANGFAALTEVPVEPANAGNSRGTPVRSSGHVPAPPPEAVGLVCRWGPFEISSGSACRHSQGVSMSSFADLGVPAPPCATLARRGINEPFPIQAATLPDALAGRDVAGKAPTGSGKTLAFGLAIAAAAAAARTPEARRPRALVLVPTRELAAQVQRELTALIDERAHGPVAAIYGGVGYGPQRKLLTRGVSAVVACPGRLEDLIATGDVRLDAVDIVVLDEADRMADMGFMPAVRRLLDRTPDDRQTLLFSATLDGDVDKLVRAYQHDPVHHAVAGNDDDDVEVAHHFWTVAREAPSASPPTSSTGRARPSCSPAPGTVPTA